jgi:hypothetical protein
MSKDKKEQSPRTGKKNTQKERPIIDEDLKKKVGKGITSSKGDFRSVNEIKGKSEKKGNNK